MEQNTFSKTDFINNLYKQGYLKTKIDVIKKAFEDNLPLEQIFICANNNFSAQQMQQIELGFKHKLTNEQVLSYAKQEYEFYKMSIYRKAYENNFSNRQMKMLFNENLQYAELEQIYKAILNKTPDKVIEEFIKYNTNWLVIQQIVYNKLYEQLNKDYYNIILMQNHNWYTKLIVKGACYNLTPEQIITCLSINDYEKCCELINGLIDETSHSIDKIKNAIARKKAIQEIKTFIKELNNTEKISDDYLFEIIREYIKQDNKNKLFLSFNL